MNLDDHAGQAAHELRHAVETDVDVDAARDRVMARAMDRRDRSRTLRVGAAVVATVALVAGLVALGSVNGSRGDDIQAGEFDGDLSARGAAILGGLPTSAIDGKDSWRLPVVADPQLGVEDGDTITVYGRGFEPHDSVGLVMCGTEAETEGVGACQLGVAGDVYRHVTYASADDQGNVVAPMILRQVITTPVTGQIDCRSAAERCLVAVGAVANYDRSGGAYVDFAGSPAFPEPTLALAPEGPLTPGQQAFALAAGLVPGRPYQVLECRDGSCTTLARGRADLAGTFSPVVTPGSEVLTEGGERLACGDGCTLELDGIGPEGASSVPFPPPVPLSFTTAAPVPPIPAPSSTLPEVLPPPSTTTTAAQPPEAPAPTSEAPSSTSTTLAPSVPPTLVPTTALPSTAGPASPGGP